MTTSIKMKHIASIKLLLLFLATAFTSLSFGTIPPIELQEGTKKLKELSSITIIDSSKTKTIVDIQAMSESESIKKDSKLGYNKNVNYAYWRIYNLKNVGSERTWIFEIYDPHIDQVEVFVKQKETLKRFPKTGYALGLHSKELIHKNFAYPISIDSGECITIYVRAYSNRYVGLNAKIHSVKSFLAYFFTEYYMLGIYYGIILILATYNFALGFLTQEKNHFHYCLYVISCAIYTFSEDGIGFQFLWPNSPIVNEFLIRASPIVLLGTFILYSDSFLQIKSKLPSLFNYIFALSFFYLVIFLAFPEHPKVHYLLYLFPYGLTFFTALKLFRSGAKSSLFFLVGNIFILFSLIIFYCRIQDWLSSNIFTVYIFNFSFVIEATVLSISLAYKVKMKNEMLNSTQLEVISQLKINEDLQKKVNRELEAKVKERTSDLEIKTTQLLEANTKLEKLKMELYEMNSKMDLNIWHLKGAVKKETEARITNDSVAFEEFSTIFPEKKCFKILYESKWSNGFFCKKCGNSKYGKGNNEHTLKCTQCQHQESVTSNTLCHGLRFSISKAFYLAYYFSRPRQDASYEKLAKELDLNKNTIWTFAKRINENKSLQNEKEGWQNLMLSIKPTKAKKQTSDFNN